MKGVEHTQYKGLFPTAELSYADNNLKVTPVIRPIQDWCRTM